jgi:tripartite-type tricarboxylate transporter receptor subunit TctC
LKRLILSIAASAWLLASLAQPALAEYPDRPIKLIVPYPPGSGTDTVARYTARRLEKSLGQSVVVENKAGGNAIIAAEAVIKAPADGYTLLWAANGPVTTNVALYEKLSYDPLKDLLPIARLAFSPMGLYVPSTSAYKNVPELFDAMKKQPMKLNYGSGSATYNIATEWLLSLAGVRANAINYKGSAPTIADLAGGQTDFAIVEYSAGLPLVQAGKIRLLAMTSDKRMASEPTVPTLQELGYKDFFQVAWWGIFAPAKLPSAVGTKLEKALLDAFADTETKTFLDKNNFSAFPGSAQELRRFQESEIKRETRIVEEFKIPKM